MKYRARINFSDTNFFDDNNSFLFGVRKKRKYYFIGVKNTAKIIDIHENILMECEYKISFFLSRISNFKIISQNFKYKIELKEIDKKLHLYYNENDIFIIDKRIFVGFYQGKIILNGIEIAKVKETGKLLSPKTLYNFEFLNNENVNFYCLILFLYWDDYHLF